MEPIEQFNSPPPTRIVVMRVMSVIIAWLSILASVAIVLIILIVVYFLNSLDRNYHEPHLGLGNILVIVSCFLSLVGSGLILDRQVWGLAPYCGGQLLFLFATLGQMDGVLDTAGWALLFVSAAVGPVLQLVFVLAERR